MSPISRVGTQGGAFQPQAQQRATGDSAQEFLQVIPSDGTIGNGAAAFAISQQAYLLTKGSAAAITLGPPTALQDGTIITVTSGSAFAHVVTGTGLINDGVTGAPHSTCTFAAFPGASMILVAAQGKWNTLSLKGVTVT